MPPDTSFASDPRLNPAAQQLSASEQVLAPRPSRVCVGVCALRAAPDPDAVQVSQALHGESFTVYGTRQGWAWGQLAVDGYVGWAPEDALAPEMETPTHWVSAIRTFLFSRPDLKSRPLAAVSLNARVRVQGGQGLFAQTTDGWVYEGHLRALGDWEDDFVAVAERFVGAPYLWGGRESAGIDCSGLIQASLAAVGVAALRDSDMQEATLGRAVDLPDFQRDPRRGDLVFWAGHVGVMIDSTHLLHANAWHMSTEVEPAQAAMDRIERVAGAVRSVRRMD